MSRAQLAALVTALEGVTVTDTALSGGSLALASKVVAAPPPEGGVAQVQAGRCFVWLTDSRLDFDGMLPIQRSTYSAFLTVSVTTPSEAHLVGAEVVRAIFSALKATSLSNSTEEWGADGWQVMVDRASGVLRVGGTFRTGVYL